MPKDFTKEEQVLLKEIVVQKITLTLVDGDDKADVKKFDAIVKLNKKLAKNIMEMK